VAFYLLPGPGPTSAHHSCPNTGSLNGPFDIHTYEAADYKNLYARTYDLAGYNAIVPEIGTFALPRAERGPRSIGSANLDLAYVPPTILKAVGFLESGWAQGSYSPLVDYGETGPVLSSHDCGYGIMQVTTGMQNVSGVPNIDQAMIGSHYAFNIARGAKILMDKWNLSPEYRPQVGERDPQTIEDWYYAIWGYNGFAFSNHPLSPAYSLNRVAFSCGDPSDGYGHDRTQYPYQELVLGCVQRPPSRAGTQLWQGQEVHMPDLNNQTWANTLNVNNWNACSYSLDCAAMDFPTPNAWHQDSTTLTVTREQVLGAPVMDFTTSSVNLTVNAGEGPVYVAFDVLNAGSGVLGYQAISDTGWLHVSPAGGVALGSDLGYKSGSLVLTAHTEGLAPGHYTGHITVTSLYGSGSPRVYTAELDVNTGPQPTPANGAQWGDNDCTNAPPDPVDSLLVLRHDAGLAADTGSCPAIGTAIAIANAFFWGDIDCSGSVDPVDALKLLRFDGGLDVAQGPGCPVLSSPVVFPG
jgi:hypothetical protein